MSKRKKRFIFSLIAVFIGFLLSIIVVEIVLTVKHRIKDTYWGNFVPDDVLGWTPRKNADFEVEWYQDVKQRIVTNSIGLRGSVEPDETKGKKVILLQGDSQIFGFGVQENEVVGKQLQKLVNDKEYVIINAGCSGYDLQNYVAQFKKLENKYDVAVNVVFFDLLNDIAASMMRATYLIDRPYYDLKDERLVFNYSKKRVKGAYYGYKLVPSLSEYNSLIKPCLAKDGYLSPNILTENIYLALAIHSKLWAKGVFKSPSFSDDDRNMASILNPYGGSWSYMEQWPKPYNEGRKLLVELLKTYKSYPNTKTVVVLLPLRDQIEYSWSELRNTFQKQFLKAKKFENRKISRFAMNSNIAGIVEEAGLLHVDPIKVFDSQKGKKELFLKGDDHLSAKGHKLLAEYVAEMLKNKGILE